MPRWLLADADRWRREYADWWGLGRSGCRAGSRDEGGLVAKLVWRVRLVAELEPGVVTETELARIERDAQAGLAELGLRLDEAKRLTAALQAQLVPAQVAALGESRRSCEACGRALVSKGHYGATFRSLFGDVPVRVRRRLACPCRGAAGVKSCTVLELGKDAPAPELAYVTARYAALAPFGQVAALLSYVDGHVAPTDFSFASAPCGASPASRRLELPP